VFGLGDALRHGCTSPITNNAAALDTGAPQANLNAIVIVQAERGELQLELLNADGSVALAVKGRPDESVSRSGSVQTDTTGRLRYRVTAAGARNGSY
jgi:hypothetical protein